MKRLLGTILTVLLLAVTVEAAAQTIQNASYQTVGYIKSDGTIQDRSYRTVGYVKDNGTIQDSSYRTVGYVKDDGTVQDRNYRTIGYAKGIPRKWAAFYFFFQK